MADTLAGSNVDTVTNDYKALVCIFLFGGNDGNNLIVPTDGDATRNYSAVTAACSRIPNVNPLDPGRLIGLNSVNADGAHVRPAIRACRSSASLYNTDKKLAILTNVGTLLAPTSQ